MLHSLKANRKVVYKLWAAAYSTYAPEWDSGERVLGSAVGDGLQVEDRRQWQSQWSIRRAVGKRVCKERRQRECAVQVYVRGRGAEVGLGTP